MKELINNIIKHQTLLFAVFVLVLTSIICAIYFLIRLNPSDLQVSVRYTSFGTEHIYSAPWTYMLSFSGFCLAICSVHLVLIGKIYQLKGRRFSLFFSWLSVFVILIAFMLLYNIVNIAGRN